MQSIIVATSLSQTLLSIIYKEQHVTAGDTLVIDLDDSSRATLGNYSIGSLALRPQVVTNWEKRDRAFKALSMPGAQLGEMFPDTKLPLYKVMAMDRLNFWYLGEYADKCFEYLMALDWKRAYVCSDLFTPIGWSLAKHSGREVIGVKTGSFRTREWYDLLHSESIPFASMLVEKETDKLFLVNNGYF